MRGACLLFLGVPLIALACSGSIGTSDAGPDAGIDSGGMADAGAADAAPFIVGPHQPYPQIPANSGVVLAAPQLVTVTYASDPNASAREALGDFMVGSRWYAAWHGEYGVGPATHLAKVRWAGSPPGSLDENVIGSMLLASMADGGLPPPSASVLYAVYLPAGSNPTFGGGAACEQIGTDFVGGFHWEASGNGVTFPFAVVPDCTSGSVVESVSRIEFSASHEFAEACTDPYPSSNTAYQISDSTSPWSTIGGEVGDVCNNQEGTEAGHTVQRIWSNYSAADGGQPCVPGLSEPFYAASAAPAAIQIVAAGQTQTFNIQGWSEAAVADWTLDAKAYPNGMTPTLTLGSSSLNNGQTQTLTVAVPAGSPSGSAALVFVFSRRSQTDFSFWPLQINVP